MSEVKQIVKELNDKLFMSDSHEYDYFCYLEYTETPIGDFIKYYGQVIWDSENDYREYAEDTDDQREDMKGYLIKEISKIANVLQKSSDAVKEVKYYPLGVCPECQGTLKESGYTWQCDSCEFNTPEGDVE